jgi:rod shape-determining protein MreC
MQKIINFIIKFKEHFVFLGLLFISFSLILLGDINKIGGFRTLVVASLGWFQKSFFFIPNISALKSENSALRELNFNLSQKVMNARVAEIENQTLRKLLGLKAKTEYPIEIAQVVGTIAIDFRNYLIIDKGLTSGIGKLMTVRNDAGFVGLVALSSKNYSLVEVLLNSNLKVPAMDLRTGVLGTINWDGSSRLLFRDIAKFLDVKIGDTIVTSKHSLKFFPYVPIGTVVSKKDEEGELFTTIEVKPFVNFAFLEEVFVIKRVVDEEILKLITEYEERLKQINMQPSKAQKLNISNLTKQKKRQDTLETNPSKGK